MKEVIFEILENRRITPGGIFRTELAGDTSDIARPGQFVGLNLLAASAPLFEIFCTLAVINARYLLMSVSLSQKLPENWDALVKTYRSGKPNYVAY